jgi:hypothetical protein
MKGTMMKRRNKMILALPLMISICCGNSYARGNHDGFIAGACAVGAALIGVAGAVAFTDWCCSETNEQLIARVDREYRSIYNQYADTMNYFGRRPINSIQDSVIYEFAAYVHNRNISQADYRSGVWSAKNRWQSCMQDMRKRVRLLQDKCRNYEEQRNLATMRQLLNNGEKLLADITLFAECLDHHRAYFNLYDSMDQIQNRYFQEISIITSERYSLVAELKGYILGCNSSRYAFRTFVKSIESDICTLQANVRSLAHNYDSARHYAHIVINQLINIKNVIVSDPRYQQELYEWEQERLERQRIAALEAQARAERDRVNALIEQNRILAQRNHIEQQKMWQRAHYMYPAPVGQVIVEVTL